MKITQINNYDIKGGAARAAYRLHHSLRGAGVDSMMCVGSATSDDWTVQGAKTLLSKGLALIRPHFRLLHQSFFCTTNPVAMHSIALIPSGRINALNQSEADLLHLHWFQDEMFSIADIGKFNKPLVWTLHDMWAFCGAEHYTDEERWRSGYKKNNRSDNERGFDLNRWTWERKRKNWRSPISIVTPSHWLAQCVRESALMHDWPVRVIANPIDINAWHPIDKTWARQLLHLPTDKPLLLFGAMDGGLDPRKGFDLLINALSVLKGTLPDLHLVVFGQNQPHKPPKLGLPIHYMGKLYDDLSLSILYSAADAFALPSRQDNLPNTGVESLACGTPIVAFNTCGLPDLVVHEHTGYLAKAFDTKDLAHGVQWLLHDKNRLKKIGANARQFAVDNFASEFIAKKYLQLYEEVLESVSIKVNLKSCN